MEPGAVETVDPIEHAPGQGAERAPWIGRGREHPQARHKMAQVVLCPRCLRRGIRGEPSEDAPEHPQMLFQSLGVPAEPEEAVGGPARQAGQPAVGRCRSRDRCGRVVVLVCFGPQHPGILAAGPALHRHQGVIDRGGNPREPSRKHGVVGAVGGDVGSQQDGSTLEPGSGPHGARRRQRALLGDEVLGPRRDEAAQSSLVGSAELIAEPDPAPAAAEGGLHHEAVELVDHEPQRLGLATPPGGHRRQEEVLIEQVPTEGRKECQEGRALEQARTEGVGDGDSAGSGGLHQAGNAEHRFRAQFEWVAVAVIDTAQDDVHRLQTLERLQADLETADSEVGTLDQRYTQMSGQVGVFEVGGVQRPRGEQHDHGVLASGRGDRAQVGSERPEERSQATDRDLADLFRQDAGDNRPVLQRITGAARRLGAVGEGHPVARPRSHQVGPVQMQEDLAGDWKPTAGAQETRVRVHQFGRDEAVADDPLGAQVDVSEDEVQQPRPLDQPRFEGPPLGRRQELGHGVE